MPDANANEGDVKPPAASGRRSSWFVFAALAVLVVFLVLHLLRDQPPGPVPLDSKLSVLVRPPERSVEPIAVDQPGALPVQSGGAMCLDVRLNEPAFVYLVWIDAAGEIIPLYPWNNELLEVKDISAPPPERRPGKLVFSPLLGKSWTFGEQSGSETVLALVRKSVLPENISIAQLLKALPPLPKLEPTEPLQTAQAMKLASEKKPPKSAAHAKSNSPLEKYIQPLTDHFDLVQAVQFGHVEKTAK